MTRQNETPGAMQDTVVLITGGADGAGASLAQFCCHSGAFVCIGDVDRESGEALVQKCREQWPAANEPGVPPRAVFVHTDVTDYQSVVNLFDKAFETYKRIDHVVAAVVATASIFEHGDSFDHALTLQTVREAPLCKVVDINLLGSLFVTRIASVYLRHNRGVDNDRSILLLSPGSAQSEQARQGVEGIMRSLRSYFASPYRHNLRINTITPRTSSNTAQHVALVAAGVLTDPSLHGKSLYVEAGRTGDMETADTPAPPEIKLTAEESPQPTAIGNGMGQKVAAAAGGIP